MDVISLAQDRDRLNGGNQGGPRQRAEALAALNSAFNSSSTSRTVTPRPAGTGQGSQRAAAVAALSNVLTAEKKPSPDSSPLGPISSPVAETSASGKIKCLSMQVIELPAYLPPTRKKKPLPIPSNNATTGYYFQCLARGHLFLFHINIQLCTIVISLLLGKYEMV